jgi:1-deoxy-D-xylulose-5-phosphate reductoisomerase
LTGVRSLEFFEVEEERYPLIAFARKALETEKSLPVALNAANEVAVEAFLKRRIGFTDIASVVGEVLGRHRTSEAGTLDEVFAVDRETRAQTENLLEKRY